MKRGILQFEELQASGSTIVKLCCHVCKIIDKFDEFFMKMLTFYRASIKQRIKFINKL